MRIHTDHLTIQDVTDAAAIARVSVKLSNHGSRSRARAFNVKLTGFSKRRPNFHDGSYVYAATWDQWGVFLSVLFDRDPNATVPNVYRNAGHFDFKTGYRFSPDANGQVAEFGFWPSDAHGDHTFNYVGVPFEQRCSKCSAVTRWER